MTKDELATQIIISMIQNSMFQLGPGVQNAQKSQFITNQICAAYKQIYKTIENPESAVGFNESNR